MKLKCMLDSWTATVTRTVSIANVWTRLFPQHMSKHVCVDLLCHNVMDTPSIIVAVINCPVVSIQQCLQMNASVPYHTGILLAVHNTLSSELLDTLMSREDSAW